MFRGTFIALMIIGFSLPVRAQESMTAQEGKDRPSFESLKARAEDYMAEMRQDVRRLELMVMEREARSRMARKEVAEYDRNLENQRETLQFVRKRVSQRTDGCVMLVGNRRYRQDTVEANVTARCDEIAETVQRRDNKAGEVADCQDSIQRQKTYLFRVKNQLSKAKTVFDEHQIRRDRAAQMLAVSDIARQTCPQGELLFASDTELGRILGAIEVEVGILEALLEMRLSEVEIDLSNIRKWQDKSTLGKDQNNE